jgi:hypothetical protein
MKKQEQNSPGQSVSLVDSWEKQLTALNNQLRASGHTVKVREPSDTTEFVVTLPQGRRPKATAGQSAQELFRMQAVPLSTPAKNPKLPPQPERKPDETQEAFEERKGYWQSHAGRIQAMARSQASRAALKSTGDK